MTSRTAARRCNVTHIRHILSNKPVGTLYSCRFSQHGIYADRHPLYDIDRHNRNSECGEVTLMSYRRANALMLMVGGNPQTPQNVLSQLAREDDPDLLEQIAENPNTHPRTLIYLAAFPQARVRIAVSYNPHCPRAIMRALSADHDADVRYTIAANPLVSEEILENMLEDENPYIAARATETLTKLQRARICEHTRPAQVVDLGSSLKQQTQAV